MVGRYERKGGGRTACCFEDGFAGGEVGWDHDHVEEGEDEEGCDFEAGEEGGFCDVLVWYYEVKTQTLTHCLSRHGK